MIEPRFAWVPPCARSLGQDCIDFWRAAGGILFDWQELSIHGILGLDEDDQFVTSDDAINVSRQNGKGVILQAIESFCAFELDYPLVMHTAHEFATSQEHQFRLEAMIQNAPDLHKRVKDRGGYKHANGQESINLKSGCRIAFKARTKGGGRGYSGDLLVWDEAMVIPDHVVGAQKPMTRASQAPFGQKTIYAGSAVDKEIHIHGVQFARIRQLGLQQSPRVSYHEWSAPFDSPDEMTKEILRDRSWWPLANPSMPEGLISEETMADEVEAMPPRIVSVELAGVGDWPEVDATYSGLFDLRAWDSMSGNHLETVDVLALDVSPMRTWATVAGAEKNKKIGIGILAREEGTGWIVPRLIELCDELRPLCVFVDERGPAASLIPDLEEAGLTIEKTGTVDYVRACGAFFDAAQQLGLEHDAHPALDAAVRGAAQRSLSDAWAWSRKHSRVDITPLVAATLAFWGVTTAEKPKFTGVAFG